MLRTVIPFQLRVWLSIFLIPCGKRNSNGCDSLVFVSMAIDQTERYEPFGQGTDTE